MRFWQSVAGDVRLVETDPAKRYMFIVKAGASMSRLGIKDGIIIRIGDADRLTLVEVMPEQCETVELGEEGT